MEQAVTQLNLRSHGGGRFSPITYTSGYCSLPIEEYNGRTPDLAAVEARIEMICSDDAGRKTDGTLRQTRLAGLHGRGRNPGFLHRAAPCTSVSEHMGPARE